MKLTAQQYAEALFLALRESADKDHDLVLDKFVKILAQNGDLDRLEGIAAEFEKLSLTKQGISQAQVITGQDIKLDSELVESLNLAAGKKLKLKTFVDPSLIGGLILRAGDELLDASLKGKLNQLQSELSK